MTSIANFYEKPQRLAWHRGDDGIPWIAVYDDDVVPIDVDLTDVLDGTTVSTVTWEENGTDVTSESNDTTGYTAQLSGVGTATSTVTMADSRVIKRTFRLRGIDVVGKGDYRNWP